MAFFFFNKTCYFRWHPETVDSHSIQKERLPVCRRSPEVVKRKFFAYI